mmetsp:Transcript_12556/g.27879  ORF Transcript_12556/g.27879 Transcript_12556/m.27879 type:complete len:214 (-) Transcript_12556:1161-1802(-)
MACSALRAEVISRRESTSLTSSCCDNLSATAICACSARAPTKFPAPPVPAAPSSPAPPAPVLNRPPPGRASAASLGKPLATVRSSTFAARCLTNSTSTAAMPRVACFTCTPPTYLHALRSPCSKGSWKASAAVSSRSPNKAYASAASSCSPKSSSSMDPTPTLPAFALKNTTSPSSCRKCAPTNSVSAATYGGKCAANPPKSTPRAALCAPCV